MKGYGYSYNEENFHGGDHPTREDALQAAMDDAGGYFDGDKAYVFTAKASDPGMANFFNGQWILEVASENLGEEVGDVAEKFTWTKEDADAVEQAIVKCLEDRGVKLNCWSAEDVKEHLIVWNPVEEEWVLHTSQSEEVRSTGGE